MTLVKFASERDEVEGFYVLATEATLRGLPKGVYEIPDDALTLLRERGIAWAQLKPSELALDEAQTIRNSPAVEL